MIGKCIKCNKTQAKLNKGQLCKDCFNKKINPMFCTNTGMDDESDDNLDEMLNDRTLIDFIKENMMKEHIRHGEMFTILKEQVDYLKTEITNKNTLIELLMT